MSVIEKIFGEKQKVEETIEIPVLCKFTKEDDVWNAYAEDLPVAVFGASFEEAQRNLVDAVIAHLEQLQEHGGVEETIQRLRCCARARRFTTEEIPSNYAFTRFNAAMHDHRITALV